MFSKNVVDVVFFLKSCFAGSCSIILRVRYILCWQKLSSKKSATVSFAAHYSILKDDHQITFPKYYSLIPTYGPESYMKF